jgi:hypothetical protein
MLQQFAADASVLACNQVTFAKCVDGSLGKISKVSDWRSDDVESWRKALGVIHFNA